MVNRVVTEGRGGNPCTGASSLPVLWGEQMELVSCPSFQVLMFPKGNEALTLEFVPFLLQFSPLGARSGLFPMLPGGFYHSHRMGL